MRPTTPNWTSPTTPRKGPNVAGKTFGIDKEGLKAVLGEIDSGALGLPEFQRSWVRPHENISSLIASISNGYPVGTLMLLATGGDVKFKKRSIEGAPTEGTGARRLILDEKQA